MPKFDAADVRILSSLQRDGSLTQTQLADLAGLSPSQCSRRVQRLIEDGVIDHYAAILNRTKLGLGVTAYIMVTLTSHSETDIETFRSRILRLPQVLECSKITGEVDYVLKLTTADLVSLNDILTNQFLRAPEVTKVQSSIVLEEMKATTELPLTTHAGL